MDDFSFEDRDEFGFGEEDFEEPFGEFEDVGLGDEERDVPEEFGEPPGEARAGTIFGLSRPFFFLLLGGGAFFCVLVVLLAVLLIAGQGPSPAQLTTTAVLATNTRVAQLLNMTETQNAVNLGLTQTATLWTPTPTVTPTFTPTDTPSPSPTEAVATVLFVTPTTQEGVGGGLPEDAINQTATALAQILAGGTPTAVALGATPTPIGVGTPTGQLPTTGLFDEIGTEGGATGLLTAGLAAVGLAAVIVAARFLRQNRKS